MKTDINQLLGKIFEFSQLENVDRALMRQKGDRKESSAEHSWHMAMMAMLIAPHYEHKLDMEKVFKLIAIHDLVEVEAGDTYFYDPKAMEDKKEREDKAANKLFKDFKNSEEFHDLWNEYETSETPEKVFAEALDKLSPAIIASCGKAKPPWYQKLSKSEMTNKNRIYMTGSKLLTDIYDNLVSDLDNRKYYKEVLRDRVKHE